MNCRELTLFQAKEVTGWHPDSLKSWFADGCPHAKKGTKYVINLKEVIRWREKDLKAKAKGATGNPTTGEDLNPQFEKARYDKAKADAQEMANALKRGELIEVSEVEERWTRVVMAIRSGIMALGSRLAPELVGLKTERQMKARIDKEARVVLSDLSNERPS